MSLDCYRQPLLGFVWWFTYRNRNTAAQRELTKLLPGQALFVVEPMEV